MPATAATAVAIAAQPTTPQMPVGNTKPEVKSGHAARVVDSLRQAAWQGKLDAPPLAATRLMQRHQRSGAIDEPFGAAIWIDRYQNNVVFANFGLVTRPRQNECKQQVLHQQPLCDLSE